jgi:hypothetical protein
VSLAIWLVSRKGDSQLSANRPNHWPPRRSKPENEETRKTNHGSRGLLSVLRVRAVEREVADRRKDEEADEHPGGAGDEGFAASVVLDDVKAVEGDAEVDAVLEVC